MTRDRKKALVLIGCIATLLFVALAAYCLLTDPQVAGESGPEVAQSEVVGGKLTPEERLHKLRERNRHREFNREHPGLFAQFVGNIWGNTFGPILGLIGLAKMAPTVICLMALLIGAFIVVKIYRTAVPAKVK